MTTDKDWCEIKVRRKQRGQLYWAVTGSLQQANCTHKHLHIQYIGHTGGLIYTIQFTIMYEWLSIQRKKHNHTMTTAKLL